MQIRHKIVELEVTLLMPGKMLNRENLLKMYDHVMSIPGVRGIKSMYISTEEMPVFNVISRLPQEENPMKSACSKCHGEYDTCGC